MQTIHPNIFTILACVNLVTLAFPFYLFVFKRPFKGPLFGQISFLISLVLTLTAFVVLQSEIQIDQIYKLLIGISALYSCFWLIQEIRLAEEKRKSSICIEAIGEILLEDTGKPFSYFEGKISERIKGKTLQWYAAKFDAFTNNKEQEEKNVE